MSSLPARRIGRGIGGGGGRRVFGGGGIGGRRASNVEYMMKQRAGRCQFIKDKICDYSTLR